MTINFYLRNKTKIQTSIVLYLRHKRKLYKYGTGETIPVEAWDATKQLVKRRSGYADHMMLNDTLEVLKHTANEIFREHVNERKILTQNSFTYEMNKRMGYIESNSNFYALMVETSSDLSISTRGRLLTIRDKLKTATKRRTLTIFDIDVRLLEKYRNYWKAKGNSDSTIKKNFGIIKSVFNKAKRAYPDFRSIDDPFKYVKIKNRSVNKEGVPFEDILRLASLNLNGNLDDARNMWMFSFYMAGIRIADHLRLCKKDVIRGQLVYSMRKTKRVEEKKRKLPLSIPAKEILLKYDLSGKKKDDFIFPFLKPWDTPEIRAKWLNDPDTLIQKTKEYVPDDMRNRSRQFLIDYSLGVQIELNELRKISNATAYVNKLLKQISERYDLPKFSTHLARHSFAQLLHSKQFRDVLQLSIKEISWLLGHSTLAITEGYMKKHEQARADENLSKVSNAFAELIASRN